MDILLLGYVNQYQSELKLILYIEMRLNTLLNIFLK